MKKQMKIATAEIKFSEEFERFFESQENAIELHENIRLNGVLVPPVIDSDNILVDGYERVRESIKNGVESIWVFQMDGHPRGHQLPSVGLQGERRIQTSA